LTIRLDLKGGQKKTVVTKGVVTYFLPEKSLEVLRGFLKGNDIREEEERWCFSALPL
jgi:hypothetical protein